MRDSDVRGAVRGWLEAKYVADSRIVEEMGIWGGSVRIDIAVINGELHGFELKSERDTLARLEGQAELYSQVFDRMTLVTAKRHLDKAESKIPPWWGITTAYFGPDRTIALKPVRKSGQNKNVEPLQLARLLWRAEGLAVLERHGFSRGYKSRNAEAIAARLADVLSPADLATEVRATLKSRSDWLGKPVSNEGQMAVSGVSGPFFSTT